MEERRKRLRDEQTRRARRSSRPEQENPDQNLANDSVPEEGEPEDSQTEIEETNDILQVLETLRIARIEETRRQRAKIREEMANRRMPEATEKEPVSEIKSPRRSGQESGLEWFSNWFLGPLVIIAVIVGLVFLFGVCSEPQRRCEDPRMCDPANLYGDPPPIIK